MELITEIFENGIATVRVGEKGVPHIFATHAKEITNNPFAGGTDNPEAAMYTGVDWVSLENRRMRTRLVIVGDIITASTPIEIAA